MGQETRPAWRAGRPCRLSGLPAHSFPSCSAFGPDFRMGSFSMTSQGTTEMGQMHSPLPPTESDAFQFRWKAAVK